MYEKTDAEDSCSIHLYSLHLIAEVGLRLLYLVLV